MKELTMEEKAKCYDEAIKAAVAAHKDEDRHLKATLERIFPELKESEDERIRRRIIHALHGDVLEMSEIKEAIAWLEKRGESELPKDLGEYIAELSKQFPEVSFAKLSRIAVRVKNWLEKQGWQKCWDSVKPVSEEDKLYLMPDKQKPADKVEPKFKVKYANSEYNVLEIKEIAGVTYYGIEDEPNHIDYVLPDNCEIINGYAIKENGCPYPTKPAVFSEQKPAETEKGVKRNDREIPFSEKEPYEGLTDFERTLADICIGWIGQELGWKQYIKDNADVLLKIAIKKFNSVQDAIFEKKPAEWSDEDEAGLSDALWAIQQARAIAKDENDIGNLRYAENWLKSIKDRVQPQPKQKWSEEDEKIINKLIAVVELYYGKGKGNELNKQRCLSWLKSLRPQKQWKPTKEQMATLEFYMVTLFPNKDKEVLFGLYSDLKQL